MTTQTKRPTVIIADDHEVVHPLLRQILAPSSTSWRTYSTDRPYSMPQTV